MFAHGGGEVVFVAYLFCFAQGGALGELCYWFCFAQGGFEGEFEFTGGFGASTIVLLGAFYAGFTVFFIHEGWLLVVLLTLFFTQGGWLA